MSTIMLSMVRLNLGVACLIVGVVAGLDLKDGECEHDGHGVGHGDPPRDDLQWRREIAIPIPVPRLSRGRLISPLRCRSRCRTCAGIAET